MIDKLTAEEQKRLLREIDKNYANASTELRAEIDSILADKGKSQRQKINALIVILTALWVLNAESIIKTSKTIMESVWIYYELYSVRVGNPLILPMSEISQMIGKTVSKRQDVIKWNRIIRANSKRLDKAVSNIVKQGIKNSKTPRQIQAELEKTLKLNRGKAKAIARTETNYYKTASKIQVGLKQEKAGNKILKTWVYTYLSKEPRPAHQAANGQTVEGMETMFDVGGFKTKAPQHFGIASQDINCNCDMRVKFDREANITIDQFQTYKGGKI
jgi:hypothetical protein